MYYRISEFMPCVYQVKFCLGATRLRPWMKYKYCFFFHDLDLYEIGHC